MQYFVDENGPRVYEQRYGAGFYDLGSGSASGDLFRRGVQTGEPNPVWPECYVVSGSFTVVDANE